MSRDDFSAKTIQALAERAGYRCSYPACGRVTIGPSALSTEAVNSTGIAAHITAAAPKGPRYDPKLTSEQRAHIGNGIWLCALHGRLVDGDVATYSAEELHRWKDSRERLTHLEQSGVQIGRPFCSRVTVANHGRITAPVTLELGRVTFISGSTGAGKTQFCEVIAALWNPTYLERWRRNRGGCSTFEVEFFIGNEAHTYRILTHAERQEFFLDGGRCPAISGAYHVQYLRERTAYSTKEESTKTLLGRVLSVSEDVLSTVLSDLEIRGPRLFAELQVNGDEVMARMSATGDLFIFEMLSGGEQGRVLLELARHLARFQSTFRPTILIIELANYMLVEEGFVVALIRSLQDEPFQSVLVHHTAPRSSLAPEIMSWRLVERHSVIWAERL